MDRKVRGQKLYVFVLMPFSKEFDDVYQLGIKAACEELNMFCERVDETHMIGPIYDKIVTSISKADLVIADLTGRNANVYYETGYAHALSKIVVHLCQEIKEIPFDLQGFQHVVYSAGRIVDFKSKLKTKLEWACEFLKTKGEEIGSLSFNFSSEGNKISDVINGKLKKTFSPDGKPAKVNTDIQLDILNSGASESQRIGPVYIYTPKFVTSVHNPLTTYLDNTLIHASSEIAGYDLRHQIDFRDTFLAGEWKSLPIVFQITGDVELMEKDDFQIPIKIRFLTESTPMDLDVIIDTKTITSNPPIIVQFAQEEHPEEISLKPQVTYERDGRIDEAGFQLTMSVKNISDENVRIGPMYVYTDDSIINFDPSSSGAFVLGIRGSCFEHSDEEGYDRKFIITEINDIQPYGYESDMLGFELDAKKCGRSFSDLLIPFMFKIFTDCGSLNYEFKIKLND